MMKKELRGTKFSLYAEVENSYEEEQEEDQLLIISEETANILKFSLTCAEQWVKVEQPQKFSILIYL